MDLKPKEYRFDTSIRWQGEGCRGTLTSEERPDVPVGCPPEFGGSGEQDRWSPEHLLTAAAESCLMATFTDMAKRRKMALKTYESRATAHLTVVDGTFRFARIDIHVRMTLGDEETRKAAEAMLHTASERCPVSASLRCPVEVTLEAGCA